MTVESMTVELSESHPVNRRPCPYMHSSNTMKTAIENWILETFWLLACIRRLLVVSE